MTFGVIKEAVCFCGGVTGRDTCEGDGASKDALFMELVRVLERVPAEGPTGRLAVMSSGNSEAEERPIDGVRNEGDPNNTSSSSLLI